MTELVLRTSILSFMKEKVLAREERLIRRSWLLTISWSYMTEKVLAREEWLVLCDSSSLDGGGGH